MDSALLYRRLFELCCTRDLDAVLDRTLDLVIEETGAARGFVVTPESGRLDVRAARNMDGGGVEGATMKPSRTVVRRAIKARAAVRVDDALEQADLGERPSVRKAQLRSILALPVLDGPRVVAVVCVDHTEPGAFDLALEKTLGALSVPLGEAFRSAERFHRLRRQSEALAGTIGGGRLVFAAGSPMEAAVDAIDRTASSDVPVLILGETGTGKELLAEEVHLRSARRGKPFVAINCAALPEQLLESELFGHVKGAFTGATTDRVGRFASADGGTLFLDEIGEMSPAVQTRFLRVLEVGELQRVGDDATQRVDVRVVAATHRDLLGSEVGFRQDLYYRLAVVTVPVPPLRERPQDVLLLAEAFCLEAALEMGRQVEGISDGARAVLVRHEWPGNVRELRNAVRRATIFCRGTQIEAGDLPPELGGARVPGPQPIAARPESYAELQLAKKAAGLELERAFAAGLLEDSAGNVAAAARKAGLSRPAFYDLLTRVGLDPTSFRR